MFLEKLCEFAGQMENLPPPMYQATPIRYTVILSADGHYKQIIEDSSDKNKHGSIYIAPSCKRSSSVKPKLLVDNAEYTFGIARATSNPARVRAQHEAYVALSQDCAEVTQEPSVKAVGCFLASLDSDLILKEKPDLEPVDNITFRVDGVYPFALETVKRYWAKKVAAASDTEHTMQCLVCGMMRPPVERLPIVIKGIPGGQSTGLTLISANAAAFESYGLNASLIAPTCETCGERFGNALNELLRREDTHIVIPPLAYIFWTREPVPDMNMLSLLQATPGEVKKLFESTWGRSPRYTYIQENAFYAATLSASGARVVLRDWIEKPVEVVQTNLRRYFQLQELQGERDEPLRFPLHSLINATINRDTQEKPAAQVGEALLRVALHGGELPSSLMYRVLRRIRASRRIQPEQAAFIKMVLLSRQNSFTTDHERGHDMTRINEDSKDAAYLCGRLLAQLDYIQYKALGKVNATIVDRFYGTASTAPAVVFPRLLRGAQVHLATIRQKRSKPVIGYIDYLDRELAALLEDLPEFPPPLDFDKQGMFALGFYHQKAKFLSQWRSAGSNDAADTQNDANDTDESSSSNSEKE